MDPRLITRLLLASSLALLPCAAQEGGEVTVQFLSFPKAVAPEPVELLVGEGETIEVQIPSNDLSKPYKVKRLAAWAVGKSVPGAEGKEAFEVFGQAPSLAAPSQIILLVRKGGANADGMEVIPIANNIADFGGGVFLFLNAAKVDIAGEIGNEKFALKPGKHSIVRPKADRDKLRQGRSLVHTTLYFRKDDEARPFFSSTWPLNDKARSLIFFYHDPNTQNVRLHTIRDFLP